MKAIILSYAFAHKMSYEQVITESSIDEYITSTDTITMWYTKCREICMDALHNIYNENKIGGEGHIVEIDESKIGRRKYNRGRLIEGTWILGMIDREGGFRLEICPNNKRDKLTLEALITKNVAPGSIIMTDCWKGYTGLTEKGFQHFTVNHKYHFVDCETGANTQRIESNWRPLKQWLSRGGVKKEHMAMHLCEFLWRKKNADDKIDPFNALIQDIKKLYPL